MCIYKHILNTWHSISQVGWFFHQSSGMPFGPGRWLHNRIGGSSQHSDQNPAKILIPSIYGMSTVYLHLRLMFMVNVGKYTIHGCCGYMWIRWILQILILESMTCSDNKFGRICTLQMQTFNARYIIYTQKILKDSAVCVKTHSVHSLQWMLDGGLILQAWHAQAIFPAVDYISWEEPAEFFGNVQDRWKATT